MRSEQGRVVREIRMLRATRRGLETELTSATAPVLDPTPLLEENEEGRVLCERENRLEETAASLAGGRRMVQEESTQEPGMAA